MKFMLDAAFCLHIIRKKPFAVLEKLQMQRIGDVVVSSISIADLAARVSQSSNPEQNREALYSFLIPLKIIPFDHNAAFQYAEISTLMINKTEGFGGMDMLVAAHAMSLSLPLVTTDTRKFGKIPNLQFTDWM